MRTESVEQNENKGEDFSAQAARWRQAFDQSFTQAHEGMEDLRRDYLAIQTGGQAYALRLAEVAGLQTLRVLSPCPSSRGDLLGLSSFRGNVVPVYDLRVLLGHAGGASPGWWVIAADGALGLAFDAFERHLRLPPEACTESGDSEQRPYAAEALRVDGQLRPLISIAAILADIRASIGAGQL